MDWYKILQIFLKNDSTVSDILRVVPDYQMTLGNIAPVGSLQAFCNIDVRMLDILSDLCFALCVLSRVHLIETP